MRYIIAPKSALLGHGITPATPTVTNGMIVVNENELKYRYPDKPLEELVALVDGIEVSRVEALDYVKGRKTITQIKQKENE